VCIPQRRSEPEPDVSVARGGIDDYEDHHPGPSDVALIVEVTRSGVARDRALARVYGVGGIPVYWILNVHKRQLEVYTNPLDRAYPSPTILSQWESVELALDGQAVGKIAVAGLFPSVTT
jgi:Uma2 family endonuclease